MGDAPQMLSRETWDVLHNLPAVVWGVRTAQKLPLRDLAVQSGTSINSLSRFERGGDIMLATALRLLAWLEDQPGQPHGADHG